MKLGIFALDEVGCLPIALHLSILVAGEKGHAASTFLLGELSLASHKRALNTPKRTENVKLVLGCIRERKNNRYRGNLSSVVLCDQFQNTLKAGHFHKNETYL